MVLGTPKNKCPHGIFLAGESKARFCTFCNPAFARGVSGGQGEPIEEEDQEAPEVLDAAEFMAQEVGQRLEGSL